MNDFLKTPEGQEMVGPTGGIQGLIGTLFGKPYEAGSWQDKLIETFSGTHDFIGGSLSGLYDENGNIKRGMTDTERAIYNNLITTSAIPVAAPFAAAELLPPEVWQAISILLEINGVEIKNQRGQCENQRGQNQRGQCESIIDMGYEAPINQV